MIIIQFIMSRIKAPFKPYEGSRQKDKHIRITKSMMMNKNYIDLSYSAKTLYAYMKLWACGDQEFEFSWSLAKNLIKSNTTYITSKNELIDKKFLLCVRTCKCSRMPNKYKFISDWQNQ